MIGTVERSTEVILEENYNVYTFSEAQDYDDILSGLIGKPVKFTSDQCSQTIKVKAEQSVINNSQLIENLLNN